MAYHILTVEKSEMIKPPIPENEAERLKALYELEILDTPEVRLFDAATSHAAYVWGSL